MDQEKIGRFIAKCRKEKNLTQEQFAEKLGVTNKSISRWENGRTMPDLSLFIPISEILECSVNDLMSGEKLEKENYQEHFEKNIVNSITNINKKRRLLCSIIVIMIGLLSIFVLGSIVFNNIYFSLPYSKDNMYVEESEYGLRFVNKNSCTVYSGNIGYVLLENILRNDTKLVFISASCSIADSYNFFKQFSGESHRNEYINVSDMTDLKIYYTNEKIKTIVKADEKHLEEIIDKSHLIYETF